MKRIVLGVLMVAGMLAVLQQATAQKPKQKPAKPVQPAARLPEVDVMLGNSGLNGGSLPKRSFDSLVKQGLRLSGEGKILGFSFTYAERALYEDSAGNPLRITEYFTEYCLGDRLSEGVKEGIADRTKPGDTATFDQIKVALPSGGEARGKAMKFVIVR